MSLEQIVLCIRAKATLVLTAQSKNTAAIRTVIEAGHERGLAATEIAAADIGLRSRHSLEGAHVDRSRQRKISKQGAGRSFNDIHIAHRSRKDQTPIVVAFGVAVHRFVDGNAVDPEREIGRVVAAESADRRIAGETGTLSLQMHFDAGGLAQQIPWTRCRRLLNLSLVDARRRRGFLPI